MAKVQNSMKGIEVTSDTKLLVANLWRTCGDMFFIKFEETPWKLTWNLQIASLTKENHLTLQTFVFGFRINWHGGKSDRWSNFSPYAIGPKTRVSHQFLCCSMEAPPQIITARYHTFILIPYLHNHIELLGFWVNTNDLIYHKQVLTCQNNNLDEFLGLPNSPTKTAWTFSKVWRLLLHPQRGRHNFTREAWHRHWGRWWSWSYPECQVGTLKSSGWPNHRFFRP